MDLPLLCTSSLTSFFPTKLDFRPAFWGDWNIHTNGLDLGTQKRNERGEKEVRALWMDGWMDGAELTETHGKRRLGRRGREGGRAGRCLGAPTGWEEERRETGVLTSGYCTCVCRVQ